MSHKVLHHVLSTQEMSEISNLDTFPKTWIPQYPCKIISETPDFRNPPLQMMTNIYIDWQCKLTDGFDHDKVGNFTVGICQSLSVQSKPSVNLHCQSMEIIYHCL